MKRRPLAAILLTLPLAACASLDSGASSPAPPPPAQGAVYTYDGIPPDATRVAQGTGFVQFRATEPGRIWVGDDTQRFRIVEHPAARNDEVQVDVKRDKIAVAGLIIYDKNLQSAHQHSIFFVPDAAETVGRGAYAAIPPQAERLAQGTASVRTHAPADGRIWIGDDDRRAQVLTQLVKRGDTIDVDIKHDRIALNGTPIYQQNLESKHSYSVFFRETVVAGPSAYDSIPPAAQRLASGIGLVRALIESDGEVWIGNDYNRRLITTTKVHRGDEVEVDSKHDKIKLNARVIHTQNLESKHQHSIFFLGK